MFFWVLVRRGERNTKTRDDNPYTRFVVQYLGVSAQYIIVFRVFSHSKRMKRKEESLYYFPTEMILYFWYGNFHFRVSARVHCVNEKLKNTVHNNMIFSTMKKGQMEFWILMVHIKLEE